MSTSAAPDYNAFHGTENPNDQPPPIGLFQSLRNLSAALWKNRAAFAAGSPVAAAKDLIPDLPLHDPISKFMSNEVMHMLWGSMLHPPSSYRGAKFQYRSADGSNNSMLNPDLGKAGLPYAKSIQAQHALHGAKPDPGDLFDLLMARDGEGQESDTGISSFLLYQATIVIHDVFRTNDDDKNISDTSSYLDLSPLYGKDIDGQKAVRDNTGGFGLLKPDTFAEHRLLNQPPGVSIFLIMYNRFHNYVAKQLLAINESGKFDLPLGFNESTPAQQEAALAARDEALFQTARLITCGLYAQIAIHDYLRCLMGMHAKNTAWTLDPRREYNGLLDKGTVSRGQGNMVSVEFNLLYRFHSALSDRDSSWSTALFNGWLKGEVDPNATPEQIARGEKLTPDMLAKGDIPVPLMGRKIREENKKATVELEKRAGQKWFPVGFDPVRADGKGFAFQRNADGYFDDAQLVAELVRSFEDPMCSFGARQIPMFFRSIEILGILQARKWEIATLNEFRQFFGMSKHKRFEDINSDPRITNTLRDLYGDPDNVELYPGFLCEGQGRNVDPNASCPNKQPTALWRGIFSDAVTLVRSDRFYTTEWNVDSLTTWGMRELTSDSTINKGGMLYKLCQRSFPGYFQYNSLHLWEPYYTPAKNLLLAEEQGRLKDLDISGLEYLADGKTWTPLEAVRDSEGRIKKDFFHNLAEKSSGPFRVRRKLISNPNLKTETWRGGELAVKAAAPVASIGAYEGDSLVKTDLGDYAIIKGTILGGEQAKSWVNPAFLAEYDIPHGPLRTIMTNKYRRWDDAMSIVGSCLGGDYQAQFSSYFLSVARSIRERQERPFQRFVVPNKPEEQVFQLDVVKDYAIPVIVRFVADLLGFWDRLKTCDCPDREFSETAIYQLLDDCQDFQSWDADQTKGMKRRAAFQASIVKLKELADHGVRKYSPGLLWWRNAFRTYGPANELPAVKQLRQFAVSTTQALLSQGGFTHDEVSSIMLAFALESAHKLVGNFTEMLAYFIDPKTHAHATVGAPSSDARTARWAELQDLAAKSDTDAEIAKYALEAQRLSPTMKLVRQYVGAQPAVLPLGSGPRSVAKGAAVLLDLHAASQNARVFPSPGEFRLDRPQDAYLIYGTVYDSDGAEKATPFAKELSLAYLTGLLKHMAQLRLLRVSHDKLGRLKRVNTPEGLTRYANLQWDTLLPFPATWELRYNGVGRGVFVGDNADQGHGQNQVYQLDTTEPALPPRMQANRESLERRLAGLIKVPEMVSVVTREIPQASEE